MIAASPIDLLSLPDAQKWVFGNNPSATQSNVVLQALITSLSLQFLRKTGRASQNGAVPSQSPFNQPVSYDEVY